SFLQLTHWQSPHFHAYFPALTSYPSILGEMLSCTFNNIGFTWASSPAATELESLVMDWLGKMIGLPDEFFHSTPTSNGGGVIQTTLSETTLVTMFAAKKEAVTRYLETNPGSNPGNAYGKLVAYASDQAHSSVLKGTMIASVMFRLVESNPGDFKMKASTLQALVNADKAAGLIPFYVVASLGSTGVCSFDDLSEIGPICKKEKLWLHVDAAYAGSFLVCPEFRYLINGIENADSFAFNPSKNLLVNFDCTAMWIRDRAYLHRAFDVDPLYLKHANTAGNREFLQHWQVQLSRRFRSLKLWFVIRNYGIEGIQKMLRKQIELAKLFENLVRSESIFEIPAKRHLALIVFRLKGMENEMTEILLRRMNACEKMHCVPTSLQKKFVIRFCVTSHRTTEEDIRKDFALIKSLAHELLVETDHGKRRPRLSFSASPNAETSAKRRSSLSQNEALNWSATMEQEGTKDERKMA
ncbi:unnamed protein product, partial [Notodromas monacha]